MKCLANIYVCFNSFKLPVSFWTNVRLEAYQRTTFSLQRYCV